MSVQVLVLYQDLLPNWKSLWQRVGRLSRVLMLMQESVSSDEDLVAQEAVAISGAAGSLRTAVHTTREVVIPSRLEELGIQR